MDQELTLMQRVRRLEEQMSERIAIADEFGIQIAHERRRIDTVLGEEPKVVPMEARRGQ